MDQDSLVQNMEDKPLVTALLPLKYFKVSFLKAAIQSVLNQTASNWRLLIIVNGDDFIRLREELNWALLDSRIKIITAEHPTFVNAINTGIWTAQTSFTSLIFADDYWAKNAIDVLNDQITINPEIDFFHSSRAVVNEEGEMISKVFQSKSSFKAEDFKYGSPVKHLLCWRRELAMEIGGIDENLTNHGPDDYDFPWSMAEFGAKFKAIPECLYYYRNHCDYFRLTTHVPRSQMKKELDKILKKHGVGWSERKRIIWKKQFNGSMGGQSIYRNSLESRLKNMFNIDATKKWKQTVYK